MSDDFGMKYRFRIREMVCSDSWGVWVYRSLGNGPEYSSALLAPVKIEWDPLKDGQYIGDKEPSFQIPARDVVLHRVIDSLQFGLQQAGLTKSDRQLFGSHEATLKHLKREQEAHDRLLTMVERMHTGILVPRE